MEGTPARLRCSYCDEVVEEPVRVILVADDTRDCWAHRDCFLGALSPAGRAVLLARGEL